MEESITRVLEIFELIHSWKKAFTLGNKPFQEILKNKFDKQKVIFKVYL